MHPSPFARAALLAMAAALLTTNAAASVTTVSSPVASRNTTAATMASAIMPRVSDSNSVHHAPTGCRDTCSIPYSPPQRSIVRLAGGCAVRITWIARPSCGVGWDLAVLRVEPLNDACGGVAIERLVNESTDSLIAGRETGFFGMGGYRDSCVRIGRVLRAACWGYRLACGDTLVTPCDSTSCCESPVMLCTDEIFRRRIVRAGSRLRAPCDPRQACAPICGTPPDSLILDPPTDTLDRDPSDTGSFSMIRRRMQRPGSPGVDGPVGGRDTDQTDDSVEGPTRARRPWPWRDARPVRAPLRELRDEDWMLAATRPDMTRQR